MAVLLQVEMNKINQSYEFVIVGLELLFQENSLPVPAVSIRVTDTLILRV